VCHCEERSDEAIPLLRPDILGIASSHSLLVSRNRLVMLALLAR
jgi:hypothetical protein